MPSRIFEHMVNLFVRILFCRVKVKALERWTRQPISDHVERIIVMSFLTIYTWRQLLRLNFCSKHLLP